MKESILQARPVFQEFAPVVLAGAHKLGLGGEEMPDSSGRVHTWSWKTRTGRSFLACRAEACGSIFWEASEFQAENAEMGVLEKKRSVCKSFSRIIMPCADSRHQSS